MITVEEIVDIINKAEREVEVLVTKERESIIKHKAGRDGRLTVSWASLGYGEVRDKAYEEILNKLDGIEFADTEVSVTQKDVDHYRIVHNMVNTYGDTWR